MYFIIYDHASVQLVSVNILRYQEFNYLIIDGTIYTYDIFFRWFHYIPIFSVGKRINWTGKIDN